VISASGTATGASSIRSARSGSRRRFIEIEGAQQDEVLDNAGIATFVDLMREQPARGMFFSAGVWRQSEPGRLDADRLTAAMPAARLHLGLR